MTAPDQIRRFATLSDNGRYRYWLERSWGDGCKGFVNFIMLNPSTADAEQDDPTILRCIDFARRWGYDGMHVVNLFALRATDPAELLVARCPVGPDNNDFIDAGFLSAEITVCAWGAHKGAKARASAVLGMIESRPKVKAFALGLTADGSPRHPLYVRADAELIPYPPEDRADG